MTYDNKIKMQPFSFLVSFMGSSCQLYIFLDFTFIILILEICLDQTSDTHMY